MAQEEVSVPTQFTHSVKISETAKGIRIDVHVYANSMSDAVHQAFTMYKMAEDRAKHDKIVIAPVEVK